MYELKICHLYPDIFYAYGENNAPLILKNRMEWRGHQVTIENITRTDAFHPSQYDIIFIGAGTTTQISSMLPDFLSLKAPALMDAVEADKILLGVGSGFQVLGNSITLPDQTYYECSHILDFDTIGNYYQNTGNLILEREDGTLLVGYESHIGNTKLGPAVSPFAKVKFGIGNNDTAHTDGVHYKNTFGTYCFGPLVALNPAFADELLTLALLNKYQEAKLAPLSDELAYKARERVLGIYLPTTS